MRINISLLYFGKLLRHSLAVTVQVSTYMVCTHSITVQEMPENHAQSLAEVAP